MDFGWGQRAERVVERFLTGQSLPIVPELAPAQRRRRRIATLAS
jgi:hypothetical protein